MGRDNAKLYKRISLTFFAVSALLVFLVLLVTFLHQNITSADPLIYWTVKYHFIVTVILMFVSLTMGYILSTVISNELNKSREDSRKVMDLLLLFLSHEEKEIIKHLVKQKGKSNQADISRLEGLNRVKAFRTLQKMKDRDVIDITAHGKIRNIELKRWVSNMIFLPTDTEKPELKSADTNNEDKQKL